MAVIAVVGVFFITKWEGVLRGFLFRSHYKQKLLDFSAYMPKFPHRFT